MFFRRLRGPWAIGAVAGLVATVLVGVGATQVVSEGQVEVFLEPAGVVGDDPFMTLESPDLRMGEAERLALSGGVTVRVGIEPGLYGGSGSDHLCDPQLIADFLASDDDKAAAWASAAGIEPDEIDAFLETLTPVRLLADTWVTNHGYRDGKAVPRQSILQAGSMVLVDEFGVPRVRCKCGNPLLPPQVPDDMSRVEFVGEPWDDFDEDELLVIEPGAEAVEWFILVRLEDGRLIARPVGTVGDQDVLVDEELNWIPELDLDLPPTAAPGDGPFALPEVTSGEVEIDYDVQGPCEVRRDELVLDGDGLCRLTASAEATEPWAALEAEFEIDVFRLQQAILIEPIETLILSEGAVPLGVVTGSLLPPTFDVSGPCEIDGDELVPTALGTCEITITQDGDDRHEAAEPVVLTIEVIDGPARQAVTISIDAPATLRLGEDPITLRATTSPSRPVTFTATGACSLEGTSSLVADAVGDCVVQAVARSDDDHRRAIATDTVMVLARLQTLGLDTVPRVLVLSDTAVPLPANSSAGVPIDYEVSGPCRITADGLVATAAGDCVLVAAADGDTETEAVTETIEISVRPAGTVRQDQTISFARPADLVFGGSGVSLSASASSGLTVALTVTDGECRISGSTLTPGDAGRCTIVASQPGDGDYEAADPVSRTITVAKVSPTMTVRVTGGSATEMAGGQSRTVTGAVSSGPAAAISATTGPCTTASSTSITASSSAAGVCRVTVTAPGDTNHTPVSGSASITVKQFQTVVVSTSSSVAVGDRVGFRTSATSGLSVEVSVSPSSVCALSDAGNAIVGVGAGTCRVTASQSGNGDYLPATASTSLQVTAPNDPDDAVVTIDAPRTVTVGDPIAISAGSSAAGADITVRVSGTACGSDQQGGFVATARGTCTVTASHPATGTSGPGSAQTTVDVVGRADQLRFTCDPSCNLVSGKSAAIRVVSTSGLAAKATLSGPCSVVLSQTDGGLLIVSILADAVGTCTLSASTAGDALYEPGSGSQAITVQPVAAPVLSVSFDLGSALTIGASRTVAVQHNVSPNEVTSRVVTTSACRASLVQGATVLVVDAVEVGTCGVEITVLDASGASAAASDQMEVRQDGGVITPPTLPPITPGTLVPGPTLPPIGGG